MSKYPFLASPIETERLILVKPEMKYTGRLLEIWKNPKMTKLNSVNQITLTEAKNNMKKRIKNQGDTQISFYALLKENKYLIGSAGLNISEHNNSAELGYGIDAKYWRKGYCTELVRAVLNFAFTKTNLHRITKTNLHRIWATPAIKNKPSCKVLENCGFKREATLKDSAYIILGNIMMKHTIPFLEKTILRKRINFSSFVCIFNCFSYKLVCHNL